MLRTLTTLFACIFLAAACTKKAVPATSGTMPPEKTEKAVTAEKPAEPYKPVESATNTKTDNATGSADKTSTPAMPEKPSDEEAGSAIYSTKCTKCHAAKTVSNYNMQQWESILKSMVPKAKLSADEEAQVTAYIKSRAKQF